MTIGSTLIMLAIALGCMHLADSESASLADARSPSRHDTSVRVRPYHLLFEEYDTSACRVVLFNADVVCCVGTVDAFQVRLDSPCIGRTSSLQTSGN